MARKKKQSPEPVEKLSPTLEKAIQRMHAQADALAKLFPKPPEFHELQWIEPDLSAVQPLAEQIAGALMLHEEAQQSSDASETPKLKAARAALAAVKAKGRVPSDRNVAIMSEKLKQKVTRATIARYRKRGLLDF